MSDTENYKVKTSAFEGSLDLLLHLIEKRKLHISDISLSQITDDYIEYLKRLEEFPVRYSVDFVLTASILMLIKSKALLPSLDLTDEEEQSMDELEKRLREYQKIKELSAHIKEKFGKKIIFFRQQGIKMEPIFAPDKNTKISGLFSAIKDVLNNLPKKVLPPKVTVEKVISLGEMINNLTDRIKVSLKISFKTFSGLKTSPNSLSKKDKINVVISFLAMLELVKQGAIVAKQQCCFGDIDMETQNIGTPNYN